MPTQQYQLRELHNDTHGPSLQRYAYKVFKSVATDGKRTKDRCHGFRLHLMYNDSGNHWYCFASRAQAQPVYGTNALAIRI